MSQREQDSGKYQAVTAVFEVFTLSAISERRQVLGGGLRFHQMAKSDLLVGFLRYLQF